MAMNRMTEASRKFADRQHQRALNSEGPSRWVIDCISCDKPVEPWQTLGYQHGYCADCFGILVTPFRVS